MFSCEFCKIFKMTFFTEHLCVNTSGFRIGQQARMKKNLTLEQT